MQKLMVYEHGACIGYGFTIMYPDGKMSQPDLFDLKGDRLAEGWYQLQVTDTRWNVVVPMRIQ